MTDGDYAAALVRRATVLEIEALELAALGAGPELVEAVRLVRQAINCVAREHTAALVGADSDRTRAAILGRLEAMVPRAALERGW